MSAVNHYQHGTVVPVHPGWLRLNHWINAIAVITLILSGWKIYNASPLFPFLFPKGVTMGGWLGGALLWHFAAMWVLFLNGLVYVAINLVGGRFKQKFFPLSPGQLLRDIQSTLKGKLSHADPTQYNMVQRLAYLSTIAALVLLVMSGLVLWKSVQFPMLRELLGGYETARRVHFFSMTFVGFFIVVHLVMVALVPSTLIAMIKGHQKV